MPLDPSIPLSVKGFQLESPMAQAGGVLQLMNLLGQQKQREFQMQQLLQAAQEKEALKKSFAQLGPNADPQAIAAAALQAGDIKGYLDITKRIQDAQKTTADIGLANARTGEITGRQGALSKLGSLMTPQGYGQQPPGTALPDAVAPNDAQAIAMLQAANGQPMTVGVPNQGGLQALLAQINPNAYVTGAMRQSAPPSQSALARLMEERSKLQPGDPRIKIYDDAIAKASTHQAPVNVYSGSLTAGVDAQGRPVFVQPSGQPGVPPRQVEGVFPPERATDVNARKEAGEAEQTVEGIRARIQSLTDLVQKNPTAVGVAGGVRRLGEMAGGVVESLGGPAIPTPAIDFENEQALLLGDVRKLVEKDPNLSKDERERLYQTLGGGIKQTPSSALRAMNNVLSYVERKKMTGVSRERALERRAPAVGTVQGGYRFKGGDPALQENWERQ